MKYLLTFMILALGWTLQSTAQEKVNWLTMNEALEAQKENPRKIIIDVYTDWCYPCKLMDKNTFGNPDVAQYLNENYYAVKFNAEGNEDIQYKGNLYNNPNYDPARAGKRNYQHSFAKLLKVNAYPTVVFIDEQGDFITPIPGYRKASELELFLKMMANDDYKNIRNEEDMKAYQNNFTPSFKD